MRQRHHAPDLSKKALGEGEQQLITLPKVIAAGLIRGLTLADTDRLTYGEWLDIVAAENMLTTMNSADGTAKVRQATQADFDRFVGR